MCYWIKVSKSSSHVLIANCAKCFVFLNECIHLWSQVEIYSFMREWGAWCHRSDRERLTKSLLCWKFFNRIFTFSLWFLYFFQPIPFVPLDRMFSRKPMTRAVTAKFISGHNQSWPAGSLQRDVVSGDSSQAVQRRTPPSVCCTYTATN